MSWKPNIAKEEFIERCGVTAGLPLFESVKESLTKMNQNIVPIKSIPEPEVINMPDWIWTGTGIKAEVYHKMQDKFAEDSLIYLRAIIHLGGKATDHEVKEFFNDPEKWPLHIVSARRNYFCGEPRRIIKSFPNKTVKGPMGKPNTIWFVDFSRLYQLIEE